jgi:hypothetical protein
VGFILSVISYFKKVLCVRMVGFNWVYKNNQLFRWCQHSLPVVFFVSFLSFFNPFLRVVNEISSMVNSLWINLYKICFPQKYIILPMQSGGVRSAILLLLFSLKSRPEPAECGFSEIEILRSCPSSDGFSLTPCFCAGNTYTKQQFYRDDERRI